MEDIAPEAPRARRFARRRVDPQRLVVETIAEHADSLLRVARRHTGCQADAEDAYQRALEIFVRAAGRLDPATAHRWLHTVVKREAWAVREQRAKLVGVEDDGVLDALDDGRHLPTVEERSERFEELTRAAEALGRLKPQEVTALWLKAQGLSYSEIAERQGWTYTKVNRCLTEGRRSFLERFAGIESGAECARWTPVLSAIADGEASAETLLEVRPHLRNCASCRAVLAGMRDGTAPVAALLPPALLGAEAIAGGGLLDRLGELVLTAQERVVAPLVRAQGTFEMAGAGKVAAVAASAAAIAGGGVAVERSASDGDARAADRSRVEQAAQTTTVSAPPAPDPSGAVAAGEAVASAPAGRPDEPAARRAPEREAEASPADAKPGAEFAAEAAPTAGREPLREPPRRPAPTAPEAPATARDGGAADEFGFGG